MKIYKGIPYERKEETLEWSHQFFENVMKKQDFIYYMTTEADINWENSALLLDENNKIQGVYILGDHQVSDYVNIRDYVNLKGVEGVLLAVATEIRGQGWGEKLKDYPKSLGIDYIWGQQFKTLNNLDAWLKRRILVGETKYVYFTLEKYTWLSLS